MTDSEIEHYIDNRGHYLTQDEIHHILDVERNPQIDHYELWVGRIKHGQIVAAILSFLRDRTRNTSFMWVHGQSADRYRIGTCL